MQNVIPSVKCDTPATAKMRTRPRGYVKSLQAANQPFGRKSPNPDRRPIARIVPTTTAPEIAKTDSRCSVPGRVEMRMDGSRHTNTIEYATQAGQS